MKYWTTKDGTKLLIKDMETSHVKNCIKMLERNRPDFETEIDSAGEHGFNTSVWVFQEEAKKWDRRINALKKELRSRKEVV